MTKTQVLSVCSQVQHWIIHDEDTGASSFQSSIALDYMHDQDTGAFSLQSSTALDYTQQRHRCFQFAVKNSTGLYTTKTQVLSSTALESKEKSSKKMLHVTWRQCSCTQALHSAKKRWGDRLRQFVIPHTLSNVFSPKLPGQLERRQALHP